MTDTKNYTFIELIENNNLCIKIPTIQRDYAQGRIKEDKIRKGILHSVRDTLLNSKKLNLDFIYGNIDTSNNEHEFIPIDGQQRLTFLFLLHWYLAVTTGKENFSKYKKILCRKNGFSKFSYHTRASAKEFCDVLVSQKFKNIEFSEEVSLSEYIKGSTWFYSSWLSDPTVSSMLKMLENIHEIFHQIREEAYQKLFDKRLITFEYLDLEELKLTDDLYIKMNSRGKPLTDFENFKAGLLQQLDKNFKSQFPNVAHKLDNEWNDAFWNISQTMKIGYDEAFINFFNFLSQMLFYLSLGEENSNDLFEEREPLKVFESHRNLKFLEATLDLISESNKEINNNIEIFFGKFLSPFVMDDKIALFEDKKTNLLSRCVKKEMFSHKEKLLLFAIIYYQVSKQYSVLTISVEFKDYVRICRNYIINILQSKKDEFIPDLRERDYYEILSNISSIYDKGDIYTHLATTAKISKVYKGRISDEIDKAIIIQSNPLIKPLIHKLEDHKFIKGSIHNFGLSTSTTNSDLQLIVNNFHKFWDLGSIEITDVMRAKALLSISDYSQHISNSAFGGVWFFGGGDQWHRIIASRSEKVKPALSKLMRVLDFTHKAQPIEEQVNKLIEKELKEEIDPWRYLFLKYPHILKKTRGKHLGFAFRTDDNADFRIEKLSGTTLRSQHVNVFVEEVEKLLNDKKILSIGNCIKKNNELSFIKFPKSVEIYPANNGEWHIYNYFDPKIKNLQVKFSLTNGKYDGNNYYILKSDDKHDFVEICVEFIKEAFKL